MSLSNKELYDRRWKVTVTDPKSGESKIWGKYGTTLDESDLRIQFVVQEGEDSKHSSESTLMITNLNKKNQDWCTRKGLEVTLEAGYKELFGLVFKGKTLDNSYNSHEHTRSFGQGLNRRDDTDWTTEIKVQDTFPDRKKTVLNLTISPDSTYQTVFNKIAKHLGLDKGVVKLPKDLKKQKFNNGISLYGNAAKKLDELTEPLGLIYTIKNNTLNIYEATAGINDNVYIINADTGLIGSPEKTEKGYTFQALLIPNLFKGQYIRLDSRALKKDLIISKIRYRGDSSGNEWYTEIEGIEKK